MSLIDTNPAIIVILILSFIVTLLSTKFWIRAARKAKLIGKDMHKSDKREVPEMGGIGVLCGFLIGVFLYVAFITFFGNNISNTVQILALVTTVLLMALIGMIDDILGWKLGLRRWHKVILTLLASLPMIVINAGNSKIYIPQIGVYMELGLIFPLIIIPAMVVWSSNSFNIIAGYNGLEGGMGIIILGTLSYATWRVGETWISVIALIGVLCLLGFLFFNWYPAKIFPGDTLTYSIGGLIACIAILGSAQKVFGILFIPYAIEAVLKLRGKLKKESFAVVTQDGNLINANKEWYGLEHIAVSLLNNVFGKAKEWSVVLVLLIFEMMFVVVAVMV